nr:MAG: replication initiator protein [Microviridae sp.]
MQCINPIRIQKNLDTIKYPDGLLVPCGKCIACRKKKSYEWSVRCLHELSAYDNAVFITLTYDDEHLPDYGSLRKSHLQKFFKRLRRRIEPNNVRYFACGEYGDRRKRPHYHAIIFGLGLDDVSKKVISDSWPLGFVHYGIVEPASIRYVSQYIDKKIDGDLAVELYDNNYLERIFKISSLGLGRKYCDDNRDQILQQLHLTAKGVKMSLPRYYVERLGIPRELLCVKAVESDQSVVELITGIADLTRDQAYRSLSVAEVVHLEDTIKDIAVNRANHLQAKVDQTTKRL